MKERALCKQNLHINDALSQKQEDYSLKSGRSEIVKDFLGTGIGLTLNHRIDPRIPNISGLTIHIKNQRRTEIRERRRGGLTRSHT